MHHNQCMFGEDRTSNDLDIGPAPKALTGRRRWESTQLRLGWLQIWKVKKNDLRQINFDQNSLVPVRL